MFSIIDMDAFCLPYYTVSTVSCGIANKGYTSQPDQAILSTYTTKDVMQRGYDEIIATYDMETMGEIATLGCSSGVCREHIYYGDTIAFYDKYEEEILDYFRDNYDADFIVTLFKQSEGNLDHYKNDVAWAYIEAISMDVISGVPDSLLQPT